MISFKLNVFSNVLSMNSDCRVLLPDNVQADESLPVLWLCHGGSGDENEWLYYSTIAEIPDKERIAVVIVNANDSCYTDMAYGLDYGTHIGTELPEMSAPYYKQRERRFGNVKIGIYSKGEQQNE